MSNLYDTEHIGQSSGDKLASAFGARDLAIAYNWANDSDAARQWAQMSLDQTKNLNAQGTDLNYQIRHEAH